MSPDPSPAQRFPLMLTVPQLARACRVSRWAMQRRLAAAGVTLHRRGFGTKRAHVYFMLDDLLENAPHIIDAIENYGALIARGRPVNDNGSEDE